MDLLDVQPHVGLPLPAAQHQVVDLFRTGAGPLQHAALGDALNHLQDTWVTIHCLLFGCSVQMKALKHDPQKY